MEEPKKRLRTRIHRNGRRYRMVRFHGDLCTRLSYRKTQVTGLENIPGDGSVILAPNHSNALMDAMVILRTRKDPTVYGARADLFQAPILAKLLTFLKIVPMVRRRDGVREVLRNLDIQEDIITVLEDGVPFCMFAEGTHRAKHSLLPVGKGVFRIAVAAAQRFEKPVYVVPVGIEYSDYFRYSGTSLVQFGEPINVTEYVTSRPEAGDAELYRGLTALLRERMSELFTYIPDDENYDGVWAYTKLATVGRRRGALTERLAVNRQAVASVQPADAPGNAEKLSAALELDRKLHAAGISVLSLAGGGLGRFLLKTLCLLVWLPFQLFFGIWALLQIGSAEYMIKAHIIKDEAFYNSFRYGLYSLGFPLTLILWTLLGTFVFHCGFWLSLVASIVITYLAFPAFYRGLEEYRLWVSDLKLLFRKDLKNAFRKFKALA
ncbi:MAG: 1-acyl-sn-glycerol-3-phosphate acyltransferase [Bacteroidales bacterium]|nr:1-acyl-sn-glycerol-3-phosphate acyltransferase [Bacteroidales bacterium]